MSRKKGHRRKRRKSPPLCPKCQARADVSAGAPLAALANVLNAVRDSGHKLRFSHGVVLTWEGYVLQGRDGRWKVVTLPVHPDAPAFDPEQDEID